MTFMTSSYLYNQQQRVLVIFYFKSKEFHKSKNVSDGPVFTKEPVAVIGSSGDRVSVECEVDSNPGAEYQWIRDNNEVSHHGLCHTLYQ